MRKNLKSVPLYIPVCEVPVDSADQAVASGRAHSLRGKALLLHDSASLEHFLFELDADPEIVALILRAAARVEAEKAVRAQGDATESQ